MSSRERVPPRRNDPANGYGAGTSGIPDGPPGGAAPPKRPPPWDRPEAETTSFGDWLRRQREMREITLRDIADRTKISLRYLQAMEDNRFDLLPAPIFAKGFLREYARYVGLSPDEVVNHYLSVHQQASPGDEDVKRDQTLSRQKPHRTQPVRSWTYGVFLGVAVLVLVGVVALLAWIADRRRESPEGDKTPPPIAAPPQLSPVPLAPAPTPKRPRSPLEVTLDTTGDCWVEVTVDGKLFVAEQRMQGESLPIEAQQSVHMKLGDTGAAEIQVNGLPYPLNGKPGEVRELTIDLETLRQLRVRKEAP